jgi:hypothetical protein
MAIPEQKKATQAEREIENAKVGQGYATNAQLSKKSIGQSSPDFSFKDLVLTA